MLLNVWKLKWICDTKWHKRVLLLSTQENKQHQDYPSKQDLLHLQDQKKVVLKFLSVKSIVIAPANTGNDNNNKTAVINKDQADNGSLSMK